MIRIECVFCGWRANNYHALSKHLLNNHSDEGFVMSVGHDRNLCWCRCKAPFAIDGPAVVLTLAQHLKNRGGLAAHILELLLGDKPHG